MTDDCHCCTVFWKLVTVYGCGLTTRMKNFRIISHKPSIAEAAPWIELTIDSICVLWYFFLSADIFGHVSCGKLRNSAIRNQNSEPHFSGTETNKLYAGIIAVGPCSLYQSSTNGLVKDVFMCLEGDVSYESTIYDSQLIVSIYN